MTKTDKMARLISVISGVRSQLMNNDIPQIVIFGAGYNVRAYRNSDLNSETNVFELDIVATQSRKNEFLKTLIYFHKYESL